MAARDEARCLAQVKEVNPGRQISILGEIQTARERLVSFLNGRWMKLFILKKTVFERYLEEKLANFHIVDILR